MRNRLATVGLSLLVTLVAVACAVSPTGRKQLLLFPEGEVATMGATAFAQQKQDIPVSQDSGQRAYVQCVTNHLLTAMGQQPSEWEVVLFDANQVNAFALPGKKIGVYTGLLAVASNQDMLAAVIGHEIGHVIAKHSNERLSTQYAAQTGLSVIQALGGEMTEQKRLVYGALGLGAQYGVILPYGRQQELEADRIGLELMARAGFNPQQAVALWENMARAGGQQPPQFLSTHPSNQTRIRDLQSAMPPALALLQQARTAGKTPRCR
ncbi:MAG: M48 family metallopeptidase [Gammaproteobacteria bacterium]